MARPRKEGLDYFSHDVDAAGDPKVEPLRLLYGATGYAWYFMLLEKIYRAPGAELDISPRLVIPTLAAWIGISTEKFMEILDTALELGSFDREAYEKRHVLTSHGIKKRAGKVLDKREADRESYEGEKAEKLTGVNGGDGVSTVEKLVSTVENNMENGVYPSGNAVNPLLYFNLVSEKEEEDKVQGNGRSKSSDGKRGRKKQEPPKTAYAEFVSLTNDEYSSLVARLGSDQRARRAIEILDNYKGSSGKTYKSDYRAILNWVIMRLEEEETKGKRYMSTPRQCNLPDASEL